MPAADAQRYLSHPDVLHWVGEVDGEVVGHLLCYVQYRRSGTARQLMLYEIGVRDDWRRRGVGSRLIAAMEWWMRSSKIRKVWVLADNPTAVSFYSACGFSPSEDQPTQLSRDVR